MSLLSRATCALGLVAAGILATPPSYAAPATPSCFDSSRPTTVEEGRLTVTTAASTVPVATQILQRSGFDHNVDDLTRLLCHAPNLSAAKAVVRGQGKALWDDAVARAHGTPAPGQLPASDDRGLYWARISLTKALRQWTPSFPLSDAERAGLLHSFEYASRGITTADFDPGVRHVVVTGFDPFTLDQDIRIGNPSGSDALSLDGTRWTINGQTVEIQTMIFPVRYADFDQGMVEDALSKYYKDGPDKADLVLTSSQGRVGQFDIEAFNGARRDVNTLGDNNNVWGGGSPTAPLKFPGIDGPEFIPTSLPKEAMASTDVAPWRVRINTTVVEIRPGDTGYTISPNGPTPGSIAVEGTGGGYLSNEIAYRNTLLRDELDPSTPAGHLHVPVLFFDSANKTRITDPTYEANRASVVSSFESILRSGLAAVLH